MKRHIALQPLSRHHHKILLVAQLFKKEAPPYRGLPTDIEGKVDYAIQTLDKIYNIHIDTENKVFEIVKSTTGVFDGLIKDLEADHKAFLDAFEAFKFSKREYQIDWLDDFGHMLEHHIRIEERELFQGIQEVCPEILPQIQTVTKDI